MKIPSINDVDTNVLQKSKTSYATEKAATLRVCLAFTFAFLLIFFFANDGSTPSAHRKDGNTTLRPGITYQPAPWGKTNQIPKVIVNRKVDD